VEMVVHSNNYVSVKYSKEIVGYHFSRHEWRFL